MHYRKLKFGIPGMDEGDISSEKSLKLVFCHPVIIFRAKYFSISN